MSRSARVPFLLAVAALAVGCSEASPESTPPPTVVAVPLGLDGAQRWGEGRALAARIDADADHLVVATTIGVSVQNGDEPPVALYDGLPALLATSPDGRLAAFTTTDGRLEIWELDAARRVAGFEVAADGYTSLAFSSATDVIAGGEADVSRYPAAGGEPEQLVAAPADGVLGPVAIAADGTVAVPVGSARPTVAMWAPERGVRTVDLGLAAGDALVGVVWSGDGRHLAVLHQPPAAGETIDVWDLDGATFRGTVPIPNYVTPDQVAFQGPDRVVVPVADRLAAFDLDGAELESLPITSSEVSRLASEPEPAAVVVTGWDGRLRRWRAGEPVAEVAPAARTLVDQSVTEDGVVIVDQVGLIRHVDPGGEERTIDQYAVGTANSVDIAPGAATVAIGTSTGAVRVVGTSDGQVDDAFFRPTGNIAAVAYAPHEPLLASGVSEQISDEVWDDSVAVLDVTTGTSVATLGGEAENVNGCSFFQGVVEFSPDGSLLAVTSHDYTVHVTELDGGGVDVLAPHLGTVLDVEFSPDGALLATSSEDGTLRVWDVESRELRDEFPTALGGDWALAFTPDGAALAVADIAGEISIVDVATGEALRTFTGAKGPRGDMEFTPDGTRLVAGDAGTGVAVWSVDDGEVVARLAGHTMTVTDVAVADDGSALVSSSLDGTVRLWPLGPAEGDGRG